jgi:DNA-binding MarR family transcriptional regulator
LRIEDVIELFYSINHKFTAIEKKSMHFTSGISLTVHEVHTIDLIGRNNNINITKLAKLQGITKGAVSQMVTKLCEKQLVIKKPSPETENEVVLHLSPLGQLHFKEHDNHHREEYALLSTYMEQLSQKDTEILIKMLKAFDNFLDNKL